MEDLSPVVAAVKRGPDQRTMFAAGDKLKMPVKPP
jgi:hypothetical protein